MPVDKQVLLRYKVLNRCFRNRYREYTIDDLVDACNEALRKADKQDVSKRTIQNDINILEADYGIMLEENLKRGRQRLYRYVDTNFTLPLFRINDKERHKLQDAIRVLEDYSGEPMYDWAKSLLMQIEGGLFDDETNPVVSFQTNPDYMGQKHFAPLLRAILTKRVLKINYTPFGKDLISAKIYPYHLRQYNNRWFLIAQEIGYKNYSHYALDRILDIKEIAVAYKDTDEDFDDYFFDVIGVSVPEDDAEDIVLMVKAKRFDYILTKPLHPTQKWKKVGDDYEVRIKVKQNNELEALLLSFGSDMEVVSPTTLRKSIAKKVEEMHKKYSNDEENLHS